MLPGSNLMYYQPPGIDLMAPSYPSYNPLYTSALSQPRLDPIAPITQLGAVSDVFISTSSNQHEQVSSLGMGTALASSGLQWGSIMYPELAQSVTTTNYEELTQVRMQIEELYRNVQRTYNQTSERVAHLVRSRMQ